MSMFTSLNLVARIGIVSAYAIAPHQSDPRDICNVYSSIVAIDRPDDTIAWAIPVQSI